MLKNIKRAYLSPRSDELVSVWDGSPSIYFKYDTATFVFNNVTLTDVFRCIEFDKYDTSDFREIFAHRFISAQGVIPEIRMIFNGIMVQLRYEKAMFLLGLEDFDDVDFDSFFDTVFDYIRLDLSGSGLDFLRSLGCDIDKVLSKPFEMPINGSYHCTRIDVAFDFINYMGGILDNIIKDCFRLSDPDTRRVPVNKSSVKWSVKQGDQQTLYLGAVGSEKLLRIYDKKLQFQHSGIWTQCPYKNGDELPSSWIRFELQTRREKISHEVLYGCTTPEMALRYIYDNFAMREIKYDYDYKRFSGDITLTWLTFFDFTRIPMLIRNKNFVQYREPLERAIDYVFGQAFSNVVYLVSVMGAKGFIEELDKLLLDLQLSSLPVHIRRFQKLQTLLLSKDFKYPDYLYHDSNGHLRISKM